MLQLDQPYVLPNVEMRGCTISSPSTSRGPNAGSTESGSNECYTVWEPVVLRQEWTVSVFASLPTFPA